MTSPSTGRPWWSRRDFLKNATAVAAGGYVLSPAFALTAPVPERFDGSGFKLRAPEPNAKSGGVLRHGMPLRAPHFDIHQAGTIFILGVTACMFDNLIRRDPNDGAKTIIPDLAHSWEIAPDGQTYTFHLRQGVQFHDGAELTSEDVKATYDRIAKPRRRQHSAQRPVQGSQRDHDIEGVGVARRLEYRDDQRPNAADH
jgi:peptide/nickel transport system substrate-binding protein